jgi:hypothetical protein
LKLTLTDFARLLTLVIRAAQRNIHQCKNGINKPCAAQGQPEYAFNDQNGGDGKVRIAEVCLEEGVADSYQA